MEEKKLSIDFSYHTFVAKHQWVVGCMQILGSVLKLRTELLNAIFQPSCILETSKVKFDERITIPLKYNCQDTLICHQPQDMIL